MEENKPINQEPDYNTESPLGMPEDWNKSQGQKIRKSREKKKLQILELYAKEVEIPVIAKAVELSVSNVRGVLAKFEGVFSNLERVSDFRKAKADILSAGQLSALESALAGPKLDRASFISTLQGFEILNRAERLELGKSTENHAHSIFGRVNVTNDDSEEGNTPE